MDVGTDQYAQSPIFLLPNKKRVYKGRQRDSETARKLTADHLHAKQFFHFKSLWFLVSSSLDAEWYV